LLALVCAPLVLAAIGDFAGGAASIYGITDTTPITATCGPAKLPHICFIFFTILKDESA
jgi:hypothetical protein